ncbi:DUF4274 domain-containing protein [Leptospira barantonii]|uniref:DUF4274 domain-containing protein n=1 Tax=Leptospira barantonii TaxID=2023184 RepID=A0ABX4NMK8_9LEPT|nr:DUF4274 domain-containing protein [Leptospira barantonii]PJZ58066.1 hypothetical protein CH367_06655 [Leptospira barantonii]
MKNLPFPVERLAFIEAYFSSSAFGPIQRKSFEELKNSLELHYALLEYDWDGGMKFVRWVAESPLCDLGTALAVYWKMCPFFYTQFQNEKEAELEGENVRENFIFLKDLERRILSKEFQSENIQYDPANDETNDFFFQKTDEGKWQIPELLKKANIGKPFPQFSFFEEVYSTEEFRAFFQKYESEERKINFSETTLV